MDSWRWLPAKACGRNSEPREPAAFSAIAPAKRVARRARLPPRSGTACVEGAPRARRESDDLEVALHFPVRDRVLVLPPFPLAGTYEMIDEDFAEEFRRHLGALEIGGGVVEAARQPRDLRRL